VAIWRNRLDYELVDDTLQVHLNAIKRFFDDSWNVSMIGFSNNGGLALVWATASNDPGAYYLYDFKKRRVRPALWGIPMAVTPPFLRAQLPQKRSPVSSPVLAPVIFTSPSNKIETSTVQTPVPLNIGRNPSAT
jgi:hypothetical protein